MKYILAYVASIVITLYLASCAEIENNIEPLSDVNVHPEGILDPADPDFHGELIRKSNWDMTQCKQCHGSGYNGGLSSSSCLSCHNQPSGPENCSTCHGSETSPAPPRDLSRNTSGTERGVGAHQVHLAGGSRSKTLSCAECHNVPAVVYQPDHIDAGNQAEVLMDNYLANLNTNLPGTSTYDAELPLFSPDPLYSYEEGSCANTYCHGAFKNGNTDNIAVWTDPVSAECGTCHGDPGRTTLPERARPKTVNEGGTHVEGTDCYRCHDGVVDENLRFISTSKHIDGKLNLFGNDVTY
jgi:predicted CxxxxCH...CXXCH cytochrome family protein